MQGVCHCVWSRGKSICASAAMSSADRLASRLCIQGARQEHVWFGGGHNRFRILVYNWNMPGPINRATYLRIMQWILGCTYMFLHTVDSGTVLLWRVPLNLFTCTQLYMCTSNLYWEDWDFSGRNPRHMHKMRFWAILGQLVLKFPKSSNRDQIKTSQGLYKKFNDDLNIVLKS